MKNPTSLDMQKIRKQFPVLRQYIYVDTATSGLLYDGLLDWRQEHDLDLLIGGSKTGTKFNTLLSTTKDTVGAFFGCKRENVALVPNFSIGLNLLLEGMGNQQNILLLEGDYPSVNWPFQSRECRISFVKINADLEEQILEKVKSDNINILALSLVQWLNGVKIDLDFLKTLKKEYPDLIIIADGTQYCGTEKIDFESSGIDVLGASSYKWLLGGYGNGFMLFTDTVAAHFNCRTVGFNAAKGNLEGKDNISFTKRFEPGHLDSLAFGSLNHSLQFLSGIGMDVIAAHIKDLAQKARAGFGDLGLLEDHVMERGDYGPIFNISVPEKVYTKLRENNIICAQRGNGVRLSFHFYNTDKEIDKIMDVLRKN
ncbi:MAG TPA: aminotransferase class V-fold PLP-dependent enzyme [Arenibacter sp.]|nr:aminotransferase class V-fold PLP-dependent enzyme [Arenibacter sp.]